MNDKPFSFGSQMGKHNFLHDTKRNGKLVFMCTVFCPFPGFAVKWKLLFTSLPLKKPRKVVRELRCFFSRRDLWLLSLSSS